MQALECRHGIMQHEMNTRLKQCTSSDKAMSEWWGYWGKKTLPHFSRNHMNVLSISLSPSFPQSLTLSLSFVLSAKLKNSDREVCINPKTKWLQQYLRNAINK